MNSAFKAIKVNIPGLTDFDTDYIDYEVVDVAKKVGKADTDVVVEKKVVYSKTNISDVINSQVNLVGVDNLMKNIGQTQVVNDDTEIDYTQYPTDAADLRLKAMSVDKIYSKIPDDLKKGRSVQDFVESLTQEEFDNWVASMRPKAVNDGGDK